MLNAGYKKEALQNCERAGKEYKEAFENAIEKSTELHELKEKAIVILTEVDAYIHSLSNKPKELEKVTKDISLRRRAFEQEVEQLKLEAKESDKTSKSIAGGGVLAGAGVAAFGPTAAMGIATTFGTASTGTAIATLSGAAQVNAALAWLGGGALAAGGGGVSAGSAFLAMAGPVGWAIGGAALVGGGLLANSKNKKIAEKAEKQARELKEEKTKMDKIKTKIVAEIKAVKPLDEGVKKTVTFLKWTGKDDFRSFTLEEKESLMELMNSAEALSKRIGVKIS